MDIKHTEWNLSLLYNSDDDINMAKDREAITKVNSDFIAKWKNRSDYLTNPSILKEALDEFENIIRNYGTSGKEGFYFSLRYAQNENDAKIKAKENLIDDFSLKLDNETQFFLLNLAKIKETDKFLCAPELKEYRHFLEKSFESAKYLLSDPEEKILNLKSGASYSNWVRMTTSLLAKEERYAIDENKKKKLRNFTELTALLDSQNKKVRDNAAANVNDIFNKLTDIAEAELNSVLEDKKTDDELRGLERPDKSRHIGDDIDTQTVDKLIAAVTSAYNISARYYLLKTKLLKQKKLGYHERNVIIGSIEKKYPFKKSVELVYSVFDGLDREFGNIFRDFIDNGQIYAFPKKGKAGGAFCASRRLTLPTYILLNHTGRLHDVLTIAHEAGHGINNELAKIQNALNYGTPISTAEVASTFMEDFVLQRLLKDASDEEKLSILMIKLNEDIATIFRQVACYTFEQELHKNFRENGYLSKIEIGNLFKKHMAGYLGKYVDTKNCENWWIHWSHIRHYFYNYSYASGLLISKALQAKVKKDKSYIKNVKRFLAAGTSKSPKEIFLELGIDISDEAFWIEGLNEVNQLILETEALAKKLGKA
ncbi:MAG: M3 family oligoendopeptidase [archaeon]